jgi:transglutaminase-like putative cysteine protease
MLIKIGYELRFTVPAPTPMLLLLHTYPNVYFQTKPEQLIVDPATPYELFYDSFGNRCTRLVAAPGPLTLGCDATVQVDGWPDPVNPNAIQHSLRDLPYETLRFLLASRYCEVDKLTDFAWKTFGNGPTGYQRVVAVREFVHQHVKFGYQFARQTKSAVDALDERQGVCRDFAHLTITLCRCLGIPARYATGYLGDIGVPPDPAPMDFSAWVEVYLSNMWYTIDARHNHPRIGRVVMAYGRDAADAALTTSFGPTTLNQFTVWTQEMN